MNKQFPRILAALANLAQEMSFCMCVNEVCILVGHGLKEQQISGWRRTRMNEEEKEITPSCLSQISDVSWRKLGGPAGKSDFVRLIRFKLFIERSEMNINSHPVNHIVTSRIVISQECPDSQTARMPECLNCYLMLLIGLSRCTIDGHNMRGSQGAKSSCSSVAWMARYYFDPERR